jgi:hypothetical protein
MRIGRGQLVAQDSHLYSQERGMAESFLQEQLKRIKEMTEQMSRLRLFPEVQEVRNQASDDRYATADDKPSTPRRITRDGHRRR